MTAEAIVEFVAALAKLGASDAVQAWAMQRLAKLAGVPQEKLDAAIQAAKDAPPPKKG